MRKLSLLSALLLSACMVGPDYQMPGFDLPESWNSAQPEATAEATAVQKDWWKQFNDPTLTALIEEGLKHNDDIALAAARVAEARATLRVSNADLYPSLSAEGAAQRVDASEESYAGSTRSKPYNSFTLSAVLSYEVDLWGRIRRASESSRAQLLSEKANRDAVRLAVASDIATGYFSLIALEQQVKVTRDTVASRQASFDYQQKQYNAGAIDILTFRRAEAELATAEATLPVLEQARTEQQTALSILLGRSPKDIVGTPVLAATAALPTPPNMPAATPSTLLQRRPDVSAAEQQLIASNALIGVAKADYFPTLSLSALIGLSSSESDRLVQSSARAWNMGANAAMPLLNAGRTSGRVDAAEARNAQALATYQQTVRSAFGDVTNALNRIRTTEAEATAQTRKRRANEETVRVATLRYKTGYATQLDLLDAQRQLFAAQLDSIDANQRRLAATVTLYKALGGGWSDPAKPAATEEKPTPKAEPATSPTQATAAPVEKVAARKEAPAPFQKQVR